MCSETVLSCVLDRSGKGRQVNSTAKVIIYNICKYFERENAKSKNRGPLKFTFKTAKATGYIERTVRRDVAEKSEISVATFSQTLQNQDRTG